ncbi:MAG: FAD-binding protein [Proteobacteria bacterium]|nr:FAD-binding protein [Pseudomonadota bacterium]
MPAFIKKLKNIFSHQAAPSPKPADTNSWHNWSRRLSCEPANQIAPQSLDELAAALKSAAGSIRPAGSGHSFSALVPTDGTIISLSGFTGIRDYNPETREVTLGAGTQLHDIGEPLHKLGMALKNMGDIDKQTLAGAISTSTHGTGANLTSLSASVTGLELVTTSGAVLWCDKDHNPDIFRAAQVSLGALGVVTAIRIKCQEPYLLERREYTAPLEDVLDNWETLAKENRNIEFFFLPYSDMVAVTTLNVAAPDAAIVRAAPETKDPLETLDSVHRWLGWSKKLHRAVLNHEVRKEKLKREVDQSYKIYPTERNTRFNEMEYHLPRENGPAAIREIRDTIYNQKLDISFPIEFRLVDGDDAWLSPFYGRKSCSIAVHQFHDRDPMPYFNIIEPILRKYGGRPHWGKQHTLKAADLAELYPRWNDFLKIREQLDPEGKFLNAHLSKILGVGPKTHAPHPEAKNGNTANLPKP